jgi:hypothetical protein
LLAFRTRVDGLARGLVAEVAVHVIPIAPTLERLNSGQVNTVNRHRADRLGMWPII